MRIAVPDWQGRVSPVFDVAERVVLIDLDGECGDQRAESFASTTPHQRAQHMSELGVDVLLCGAISWPLEALLTSNGIRVVPLLCGGVEDVVQAFRDGTLEDGKFTMPGCCRRGQRVRARRRRGRSRATEEFS